MRFERGILILLGLLLLAQGKTGDAQTAAPAQRRTDSRPVIVERRPENAQIVTVVHRINGMKMLRLLLHSEEQVKLENIDQAFQMDSQVHTNIIAGLALDDGETIIARLPEGELDVETEVRTIDTTKPQDGGARTKSELQITKLFRQDFPGTPELTVIEQDGTLHNVKYVGLDGATGLSLLRLEKKSRDSIPALRDPIIAVGQIIKIYSPEPVKQSQDAPADAIYVRLGETRATVAHLIRGSTGHINRIRVKAPTLSVANLGAIATNDSGQTVGIVEALEAGEATILPQPTIRTAADRVLARNASVPRPWLGVSGQALSLVALDQILSRGWEREQAMNLLANTSGIMLTSIAPGSPAAFAAFRAGDVITRVNGREVKTRDDFSFLLDESVDKPVRFTFVRPGSTSPLSVLVRLSSRNLEPPMKQFKWEGSDSMVSSSLVSRGIETISLQPAAASAFGVSSGLLVVFVQPDSSAYNVGLRAGDIIEAINGRQVVTPEASTTFQLELGDSYTLNVSRRKQKLVFLVSKQSPN